MNTAFSVTTTSGATFDFKNIEEVSEYIRANIDDNNNAIKDCIDEIYDPFVVGCLKYYPSQILPKVDPIAWQEIVSELVESELEDLEYELDRATDGETFSCYGFEVECVEKEEEI